MKLLFILCSLCAAITTACAAPPYKLDASGTQDLHDTILAACPDIVGVSGDGTIWFDPKASADCKAAAQKAMKDYQPKKAPQVISR